MNTEKRIQMELLIILFIALIAFGLASMRWGFDSRSGIESHEKML